MFALCRNNSVFYRFFLYTASVIAKEVEAAKYSCSNYPCLLCVSGAGVA